ncbi:hypothetical protein Lalb_Chr13g0297201 [Lupinus albus]|uniref:Uncharacterized protein n=1 Tax=Lupinus albus TaxID=3870 RepID=A0A6A4PIP1_LUPAL|nr:hypothetical protein Lalb_Chr13g0297201 [Lupinus albus]
MTPLDYDTANATHQIISLPLLFFLVLDGFLILKWGSNTLKDQILIRYNNKW